MAEVVGRRPAGPVGPYSVEAHAGRLGGPHAFRLGLLLRGWGLGGLGWSPAAWSPTGAG